MVRYGFILIVSMLILTTTSLSSAHKFNVGGNRGWGVKQSREHYNAWTSRTRFRVNDTLFFKYKKGSDSVLVVKKEDYDSCNSNNPIHKMDNGDSSFSFDKTGPFYFISGNLVNCQKGEKFKVIVYSPRHHHIHAPSPTQPPAWNAPSSPSNVAPVHSATVNAPSPSEVAHVHSPINSPTINAPLPSEVAPVHSTVNAPEPNATNKIDSPPSAQGQTHPSPNATNRGSTRFSASFRVSVVVALVLGHFAV